MTTPYKAHRMTEEQVWTIKRLLDWTTDFFKSKDLDAARLGAEILLAEALGCQRIELYTRFEEVPTEEPLARYRDWVKRHAKGEPVAYLVGSKEFYSLKFHVDSRVLIPRPETEHLVLEAMEAHKAQTQKPVRLIDVGTGSGCVAITLASQIPDLELVATDISAEALEVARANASYHNVDDRIRFIEGNLLDPVPNDFQAAIIVSNPPYIGRNEIDTVESSVRDYEPELALYGGDTGLEIIRDLVRQSAAYLPPGGALIFETSPLIFDQCLEIVAKQTEFGEANVTKDLAGHRRIINAVKHKSA